MFLFIHDLGATKSFWLPQIRGAFSLGSDYSDQELIDAFTISLPHHNENQGKLNAKEVNKRIKKFIQEKGLKQQEIAKKMVLTHDFETVSSLKDERVNLVGHGLGGVFSLAYSLKNIDTISRIILINCGNNFCKPGLAISNLYYSYLSLFNSRILKRKFFKTKNIQKKNLIHIINEYSGQKTLKTGINILKNFDFSKKFANLSLEEQLDFLKIPILIIHSKFNLRSSLRSIKKIEKTLDPGHAIFRSKNTIINLDGKKYKNTQVIRYPFTRTTPQDSELVHFVYNVRKFLQGIDQTG